MNSEQQIIIYKGEDGQAQFDVVIRHEMVWLSLNQMVELFNRDKSVISRHITKIFEERELKKSSVVAKFATTAADRKTYNVDYYNLDVIISVGYRVKSKQGTQFRIWASKILKDYLIKGFAINEKRLQEKTQQLEELKRVIQLQEKVISAYPLQTSEAAGLLRVIAEYTRALAVLDDYDHQRLQLPETKSKSIHKITYKEAKEAIQQLGEQTSVSSLFGKEKDDSFKGSLENIYQTFDKKELYPSIEEKAAHLLYFVVKNHSFTDGNKRIAAFLFVWFLELNKLLYTESGSRRLDDNALVALTLMIAESNPADKDMMIKVVVNLISPQST